MDDDSTNNTSAPSSLGHVPQSRWEFDESVAAVFTDMLRRSIPQYETMRQAVLDIGLRFAQDGTYIVDLGCSRGDALAPFVEQLGQRNKYLGAEVSQPMLAASRKRFEREIDAGRVEIRDLDLRDTYPDVSASVTLCVLSLQFIPTDRRQRIVEEVYNRTTPGGVLILVEKVVGTTAEFTALMVDLYHKLKTAQGYSPEEVERKRLALEGVLVPITARENENLMSRAGFRKIDCFWRWMNFAGWIARK